MWGPSNEEEKQNCDGMLLLLLHGCIALAKMYPDQIQMKYVDTKGTNGK